MSSWQPQGTAGLPVPPLPAGRVQGLKDGSVRSRGRSARLARPLVPEAGPAKMARDGPRPSAPASDPRPNRPAAESPDSRRREEPLPSPQGTPASLRSDCSLGSRAPASSARRGARPGVPSRPGNYEPVAAGPTPTSTPAAAMIGPRSRCGVRTIPLRGPHDPRTLSAGLGVRVWVLRPVKSLL